MRLPPPVLALSPGELTARDGPAFLAKVRAVAAAGVRGVLLREPALEERAFLELARALRAVLDEIGGESGGAREGERPREAQGWLGVHDRAHLALLANADAVHLGFRSLPPERIPAAWRARLAVGLSAHQRDDPPAWAAADYLFYGPVRDTPSKRAWLAPTGFDGLSRACELATKPIWALGGLGPGDVAAALAAGAKGVAARGGILGAKDPAAAAQRYAAAARAAGV